MGILDDLLKRVERVNVGLKSGEIIRDAVSRHPDEIMELQKQQLFEGKAASGEDIRPYYSEDIKPRGYFRTPESAANYSAWKRDGISYPYSANRNPDAPNLYINGRFHDELGVQFTSDMVGIIPTTFYASGIVAKYGAETFGLTRANWISLFEDYGVYYELMDDIKSIIYE